MPFTLAPPPARSEAAARVYPTPGLILAAFIPAVHVGGAVSRWRLGRPHADKQEGLRPRATAGYAGAAGAGCRRRRQELIEEVRRGRVCGAVAGRGVGGTASAVRHLP